MKNLFATLAVMLVLSVFTLADGGVPIGSRQCPPSPEPCPTSLRTEVLVDEKPIFRGILLKEIARVLFWRW